MVIISLLFNLNNINVENYLPSIHHFLDKIKSRDNAFELFPVPDIVSGVIYSLKEEQIFQNISRKENCHNNSVMENFFGLLTQEIYYGVVYYGYENLKSEIKQ